MTNAHRTVLLVDDDPDIREIITMIMRLYSVPLLTARDGTEALASMRGSSELGVVLLDLRMPTLDGEAVLREMKRDPSLAKTPVIVLSGNRDGATVAATLGADGYLLKPIEMDDLMDAVARFVPVAGPPTKH